MESSRTSPKGSNSTVNTTLRADPGPRFLTPREAYTGPIMIGSSVRCGRTPSRRASSISPRVASISARVFRASSTNPHVK